VKGEEGEDRGGEGEIGVVRVYRARVCCAPRLGANGARGSRRNPGITITEIVPSNGTAGSRSLAGSLTLAGRSRAGVF